MSKGGWRFSPHPRSYSPEYHPFLKLASQAPGQGRFRVRRR